MKGVFGDVDQEEKCQRRKLLKERGRIGRGGRTAVVIVFDVVLDKRERV